MNIGHFSPVLLQFGAVGKSKEDLAVGRPKEDMEEPKQVDIDSFVAMKALNVAGMRNLAGLLDTFPGDNFGNFSFYVDDTETPDKQDVETLEAKVEQAKAKKDEKAQGITLSGYETFAKALPKETKAVNDAEAELDNLKGGLLVKLLQQLANAVNASKTVKAE